VTRRAVPVAELTADFEAWLAARLPLITDDLTVKHQEMAGSRSRFLRGTYYLWLYRMVALMPDLLARPEVPAVGDLHVENFGSWRDRHGVRRWGVNDLDELAWASYPVDLVRLATSAALTPDVPVSPRRLCEIVLRHWYRAADRVAALDLNDGAGRHLRELVTASGRASSYFATLTAAPQVNPALIPLTVRAAAEQTVPGHWRPTWYARRAGVGSLGHPRYVAVGRAGPHRDAERPGGAGQPDASMQPGESMQAREVKALGPGTAVWLRDRLGGQHSGRLPRPDDGLYPRVVAAGQGADASRRLAGWRIRRLAPDVVRIKLAGLAEQDAHRVIASMAEAVAWVHAVAPDQLAAARADSERLGGDWLHRAVRVMTDDTRAAYRQWRESFLATTGR
jgi:Uncharacterized protein conserved in bacteria (DUF2252)